MRVSAFLCWLVVGVGAVAVVAVARGGDDEQAEKAKAALIIGPIDYQNSCGECHKAEVEAWKHTKHFATFSEMHRTEEAKKVAEKMGLSSIKRSVTCRQCHYTSKLDDDQVRPTWGITCESCHGPAKNWVEIHSHIGGDPSAKAITPGESKKVETPDQRRARLAKAAEKGMINSTMLYQIASNCFGCHTVPNEKLVNVGGHRAGSAFDLLSWSQGEIRHNFVSSADGKTNRPATAEQKRMLYVVGTMVDLEFTLRNLAHATEDGRFKTEMTERANRLRQKAEKILQAEPIPELAGALKEVPAEFGAATKVDAALADKLGEATRAFVKNHDGSKLAKLDALLPGPDTYKGQAFSP